MKQIIYTDSTLEFLINSIVNDISGIEDYSKLIITNNLIPGIFIKVIELDLDNYFKKILTSETLGILLIPESEKTTIQCINLNFIVFSYNSNEKIIENMSLTEYENVAKTLNIDLTGSNWNLIEILT